MDIFLVRHGETDANAQKIIQGWLDTDLNENGRRQAHAAAEGFDAEIEAIYSSDLKRAVQTAEAFQKRFPAVPYYEDVRLRERNFGEATGRPGADMDWDGFWAAPRDEAPFPGAETFDEYNRRVQDFIENLRLSGSSRVLIVTHSGTINRMRELITGEGYTLNANGSIQHFILE